MPPGEHSLQLVLVEEAADLRQVRAIQARQEAGLERHAVDVEFVRAAQKILQRHAPRRSGLLRINLAEVAVVAVTVDSGLQ